MPISPDRSPQWEEAGRSTRVRLSHDSSLAPHGDTAAERLTDDLLVEILSRVPAKSICRFKCISKHWLSLMDHPDHRKKLPQTLACFFYNSTREERLSGSAPRFISVLGSRSTLIDTSFSFLPNQWRVELLDCCNGLLLLHRSLDASLQGDEFSYIVCNPVTGEWAEFPDPKHEGVEVAARLGFESAVSPHFHVFVLVMDEYNSCLSGVNIFSSETERWVYKKQGWKRDIKLGGYLWPTTVYLNGRLHFYAYVREQNTHFFYLQLAAVDTNGETWSKICAPSFLDGSFLQQSQGRLHYAGYQRVGSVNVNRFLLYVLKDYDRDEWILRHSVETSYILGGMPAAPHMDFYLIAVHPECNLVFFRTGLDMKCYDMDSRQVKEICNFEDGVPPLVLFEPLYAELGSLHK